MYCTNCGKENIIGANYCGYCGTKVAEMISWKAENCMQKEEHAMKVEQVLVEKVEAAADAINKAVDTENVLETKSETQPEIKPETKPETQHEIKPETKPETQHDTCEPSKPKTKIGPVTGPEYREGDTAYARCVSIDHGNAKFLCIDNVTSFYFSANTAKQMVPDFKVGSYVWAKLLSPSNEGKHIYKVYLKNRDLSSVGAEMAMFYNLHNTGDTMYAPVAEIGKGYCDLAIGPHAMLRMWYKDLPAGYDLNSITIGSVKKITIKSLIKESSKRISVDIEIDEAKEVEEIAFAAEKELWSKLPKSMLGNEVDFPNNILELLRNNASVSRELFGGSEVNRSNLRSILDAKYQEMRTKKLLNIKADNGCLYFDYDLDLRDENGVPQCACFKKQKGKSWVLCMIGFTSAERYFDMYVYVDNWKTILDELADLACKGESWDWPMSNSNEKSILKSYLLHNFYKVWLDGLIVEENGEAIFNTGHVDGSYDQIYCYLRKNTHADFYNRKWEVGFFACRAKGEKGKLMNAMFRSFPDKPVYLGAGGNGDRIYNPHKELFCDYNHIISDNIDRLPTGFLKNRLSFDPEISRLLDEYMSGNKSSYYRVKEIVKAKNDRGELLRREIQNGLEDAVKVTQKYAGWNPGMAIPMYYPRSNRISLMLPLKLRGGSAGAFDVALVVERLANGNYQGQTILTPEMAYQDARQIERPYSEWLSTDMVNLMGREAA